jgi:hypothetical protein
MLKLTPEAKSRLILGALALGVFTLSAAPALAMTQTPFESHFFTTLSFPLGDQILNTGLGLLFGPIAALAAGVGGYKTYQNLHDAQHTGEYANKAIFGYGTMALTGSAAFIYQGIVNKGKVQGLVAAVAPHLTHHASLVHHFLR